MKSVICSIVAVLTLFMLATQVSAQCDIDITGLSMDLSEGVQVGDMVTFTASAVSSCGGTIYYRFDLIPNYGTTDYDPFNNFTTPRDFSTQANYTHTFNTAGSYIMVVWASDTQGFSTASAPPIIGTSITVGGGQGDIDVTGLSLNLTQRPQVNDAVTFTGSAISGSGGTIYYRFDLIPNYGTTDYDPFNDYTTPQDFSTQASCTHTFTSAGSYIVVVWASDTQGFSTASAPPIIGGSVTVTTGASTCAPEIVLYGPVDAGIIVPNVRATIRSTCGVDIDQSTIELLFDSVLRTPTISGGGSEVRINWSPPFALELYSMHNVTVRARDVNGQSAEQSWSFTVFESY